MIFENSSPKGIFGPYMSDSPNWSLTANSRSFQAAALNSLQRYCVTGTIYKKDTSIRALRTHPRPSLDDVIIDVHFGVGHEVVVLVIGTLIKELFRILLRLLFSLQLLRS